MFINLILIIDSLAQDYGQWILADSINEPRQDHSFVVLTNGNLEYY